MRVLGKILKWLAILAVLAVVGVAGWLAFAPPALIRVATAYSAKIVCSNQFLAWRDGQEVLALDVQAPGHPILKYISVDVDALERTVSARLLGLFGEGRAVHRPGVGCASVPGGAEAQAMPPLPEPGQPHMAALIVGAGPTLTVDETKEPAPQGFGETFEARARARGFAHDLYRWLVLSPKRGGKLPESASA